MGLKSNLFRGDAKLEACAISHPAHIRQPAVGSHVEKIQAALQYLDGLVIAPAELQERRYGPSTAAAVLAYKRKRKIINTSYQTQADNVVGIMTIAALDKDLVSNQKPAVARPRFGCKVSCGSHALGVTDAAVPLNGSGAGPLPAGLSRV